MGKKWKELSTDNGDGGGRGGKEFVFTVKIERSIKRNKINLRIRVY